MAFSLTVPCKPLPPATLCPSKVRGGVNTGAQVIRAAEERTPVGQTHLKGALGLEGEQAYYGFPKHTFLNWSPKTSEPVMRRTCRRSGECGVLTWSCKIDMSGALDSSSHPIPLVVCPPHLPGGSSSGRGRGSGGSSSTGGNTGTSTPISRKEEEGSQDRWGRITVSQGPAVGKPSKGRTKSAGACFSL